MRVPELEPHPRGLTRPDPEPPPLVAVTMGDPAGVGPEVVVKAIRSGECLKDCRPVVVGGREIMQEACRRFGEPMKMRSITLDELPKEFDTSVLYLVEALGADLKRVVPGAHSGTTGRAAAAAVRLAAKLATDGKVRAITTAPISKEAFLDLGHRRLHRPHRVPGRALRRQALGPDVHLAAAPGDAGHDPSPARAGRAHA